MLPEDCLFCALMAHRPVARGFPASLQPGREALTTQHTTHPAPVAPLELEVVQHMRQYCMLNINGNVSTSGQPILGNYANFDARYPDRWL